MLQLLYKKTQIPISKRQMTTRINLRKGINVHKLWNAEGRGRQFCYDLFLKTAGTTIVAEHKLKIGVKKFFTRKVR